MYSITFYTVTFSELSPKGYVLSLFGKITKALSLTLWSIRKENLLEIINNSTQKVDDIRIVY